MPVSRAPSPPTLPPFRPLPESRVPSVAAVSPGNGATGVDLQTQIRVTFDKPIDLTTLTTATLIVAGPDQIGVPGSISYDPSSQTALFTPSRPLSPGTVYQGTLTRGIKDVFKNYFTIGYDWRFTTLDNEKDPPAPICPERTRPPYLAFVTPTSATVAWECTPEGTIEWGAAPNVAYRFDDLVGWRKHFVTLPGLLPNTRYVYRVSVGGRVLGEGSFQTAKGAGDNQFNFVAFADSGVKSSDQLALAALVKKLDPSFVIVPGDVVYEDGYDPEYDPRYFFPYQDLIRQIPFFPVAGDHDVVADDGATFLANFFHPTGKLYYEFHWGETDFFALDSTLTRYHKYDPGQLAWFQEAISQSAARWKIVYFHHPPYSSGLFGNLPNMKDFVPLFEKYHVDVVFTGHAHDYERTVPINGVTYFVTGGGGAYLTQSPGISPFTAHSQSVHHLISASMTSDALTLQALDENGVSFDSVVIQK